MDYFEVITDASTGNQTIRPYTPEEIAACEAACGQPALINSMPMQPGDVPRTSADVTKARRLLGFAPRTQVEEGVRQFVKWWQTA